MDILILVVVMVVVGLIMGWVAGLIWKGERPYGVQTDYIVSVITAVVVGLLDYYVIPALKFSETMKWLGVALEPPLSSLLVLWIMRKAKK